MVFNTKGSTRVLALVIPGSRQRLGQRDTKRKYIRVGLNLVSGFLQLYIGSKEGMFVLSVVVVVGGVLEQWNNRNNWCQIYVKDNQ